MSNGRTILDGTGKGTGWLPVIWICLFDIILRAIEKYQPMILLRTPDGSVEDFRTDEAHFDDSRKVTNVSGVQKYNKEKGTCLCVLEAATARDQGFERCLSCSRGKLALEKMIFYHLRTGLKGLKYEFFTPPDTSPFTLI